MAGKVFEEVPVEQLRWRCDPNSLPSETTETKTFVDFSRILIVNWKNRKQFLG